MPRQGLGRQAVIAVGWLACHACRRVPCRRQARYACPPAPGGRGGNAPVGAVPLAARHQVVLPSFVAHLQSVTPAHGDCAPRSSSVCPVAVKPAGRLNVW